VRGVEQAARWPSGIGADDHPGGEPVIRSLS